jgi:transcription elongation factor Elf1
MHKHCKDCRMHHNAKHPKGSPLVSPYNDWCCKYSRKASHAVGHCKLHNGKEVSDEIYEDRIQRLLRWFQFV